MDKPACVFISMPLYRGTEHVAQALDSIRQQTFTDFKVLISVDGNDHASADACRPFLSDRRFEIVIQPERLGWAGNMNFLAGRFDGEFFCYWQHDDHCAPKYLEALCRYASLHPEASAVYCDMQVYGEEDRLICRDSVTGFALERVLLQIDKPHVPAVRCLIRAKALRESLPIGAHAGIWLFSLARSGEFHRVPEILYFRRERTDSLAFTMPREPADVMWRASLDWATGVVANVHPLITPGEHLKLLCLVLDRVLGGKIKAKLKYRFEGTSRKLQVAFARHFTEEATSLLARSGEKPGLDPEELVRTLRARKAASDVEALLLEALTTRETLPDKAISAEYRPPAHR
jgi:glycosyltransferase involved in cell wall biosynthesis